MLGGGEDGAIILCWDGRIWCDNTGLDWGEEGVIILLLGRGKGVIILVWDGEKKV